MRLAESRNSMRMIYAARKADVVAARSAALGHIHRAPGAPGPSGCPPASFIEWAWLSLYFWAPLECSPATGAHLGASLASGNQTRTSGWPDAAT